MVVMVIIFAGSLKITGFTITQDLTEWYIIMELSLQAGKLKAYFILMKFKTKTNTVKTPIYNKIEKIIH